MTDKLIILWKNEDGTYSQQTPGRMVASTIAERMLKKFAKDHTVFVLALEEDDIKVEKINA
jgi:hypothetical protein